MSTKPIERAERLANAAPEQGSTAIWAFAFGATLAAAEILLFEWSAREMALGALVGTCVWGAAAYFWSAADLVPRGTLQEAPPGIAVDPGGFDFPSRFALIALICIPFAWLADRLDVGAVFVPGQQWGWAAAAAVVLVRIRRWERLHGRRVIYDPDAHSPRPYAGPPL